MTQRQTWDRVPLTVVTSPFQLKGKRSRPPCLGEEWENPTRRRACGWEVSLGKPNVKPLCPLPASPFAWQTRPLSVEEARDPTVMHCLSSHGDQARSGHATDELRGGQAHGHQPHGGSGTHTRTHVMPRCGSAGPGLLPSGSSEKN